MNIQINHACDQFSKTALECVQHATGSSASIFTWFDERGKMLAYKRNGLSDSMIDEYYANFAESDPLCVSRLQTERAKIATLCNFRTKSRHEELTAYGAFTTRYRIADEIDFVLWAGGAPVACVAAMNLSPKTSFSTLVNFQPLFDFINFGFSLLPSVKRLNVESRLMNEFKMTGKERNIANMVCDGASNQEIADRLCVEVATVKTHLFHIYEKLGVRSRAKAAAMLADS